MFYECSKQETCKSKLRSFKNAAIIYRSIFCNLAATIPVEPLVEETTIIDFG